MTICPNCSFDLTLDRTIKRGDFTLDPRGPITYQGRQVKLSKAQRCMMFTLAKSDGRIVSIEALAERCCYAESKKTVRSHLSILRRKLEAQGVPVPFENERDVGYYWEATASSAAFSPRQRTLKPSWLSSSSFVLPQFVQTKCTLGSASE